MLLDRKQAPAEFRIIEELPGEWHHVRLQLRRHVLVLELGVELAIVGWESVWH